MRSIEKTGKRTEDAISAGLKELGCDLSDVTIDILDAGSPGLFGMFGRLAKVRLTVNEEESGLEFDMPEFSLDSKKPKGEKQTPKAPKASVRPEESKAEKKSRRSETAAAPSEAQQDRPEAPRKEEAPKSRRASKREPDEPAAEKPDETFVPTDPATLSETGRIAYDFLKNLTEKMGVNVAIQVREEENHLSVAMMGDTLGILIGRRGDTLDALQYLTSLLINKNREDYMRVSLDTENYRAKREEALTKLALRMANRARKTGRRVTMEPMNPYERRVLHSALQGHPFVTTHSEGEEPYRRVIITLKGDDEA